MYLISPVSSPPSKSHNYPFPSPMQHLYPNLCYLASVIDYSASEMATLPLYSCSHFNPLFTKHQMILSKCQSYCHTQVSFGRFSWCLINQVFDAMAYDPYIICYMAVSSATSYTSPASRAHTRALVRS